MFISFDDDELYMEKYGIVNSAPLNILTETENAICALKFTSPNTLDSR